MVSCYFVLFYFIWNGNWRWLTLDLIVCSVRASTLFILSCRLDSDAKHYPSSSLQWHYLFVYAKITKKENSKTGTNLLVGESKLIHKRRRPDLRASPNPNRGASTLRKEDLPRIMEAAGIEKSPTTPNTSQIKFYSKCPNGLSCLVNGFLALHDKVKNWAEPEWSRRDSGLRTGSGGTRPVLTAASFGKNTSWEWKNLGKTFFVKIIKIKNEGDTRTNYARATGAGDSYLLFHFFLLNSSRRMTLKYLFQFEGDSWDTTSTLAQVLISKLKSLSTVHYSKSLSVVAPHE